MKRSLFITALLILQIVLHAQYVEDALRYSQLYYQGTARSMGIGGAISPVGGDFTTLSTNPGGMAIFRKSDFSASLEAFNRKSESEYNGSVSDGTKTIFDISNIGYVSTKPIGKGGRGWKFWQIGVGMNRLNNFNGETVIQGLNREGNQVPTSMIDVYYEQTLDMIDAGYGIEEINDYDPFYLGPAWETYLLDTIRDNQGQLLLDSPVPYQTDLWQYQSITTKGSNNEFLVAGSANFDDILYIGATLGLPYLRYFQESVYEESAVDDSSSFDYWGVQENLKTTGWGVNLKLGMILRPIDFVRLGVAFHTPTYYFSMKDEYQTFTYSKLKTLSTGNWEESGFDSPQGEYKYKLTTPMRFIGSLAFVVKEFGFISAEYEYVNYSSTKFSPEGDFINDNQGIKDSYTGVGNIRVGTEWRISRISLRAGYGYSGSPYKNNLNDGKRQSFSGGIGYTGDDFMLDFAYVRAVTNQDYYLYSYSNSTIDPPIEIQSNASHETFTSQNFVLTLRYFFAKK